MAFKRITYNFSYTLMKNSKYLRQVNEEVHINQYKQFS